MTESYNYEYFCGANVSIKFSKAVQMDVAGISYQIEDSSTPIYGYSSRRFDAVAPGQKIVRGTFVVNYKEFNTVYDSIRNTTIETFEPFKLTKDQQKLTGSEQYNDIYEHHSNAIEEQFIDPQTNKVRPGSEEALTQYLQKVMATNAYGRFDAISMAQNLMEDFSIAGPRVPRLTLENDASSRANTTSLNLLAKPFDIEISFGENPNKALGVKNNYFTIVQCYVNQIGGTIQINEDVLLQEFSFFARDIRSPR